MANELDYLKQQQSQIDRQYKAAQKIYDQQVAQLQQLQPQYEQSIIQGYESQIPMLQQTAQKSLADIGMQKENVGQTRESALTTARRQYEQGLQKSQQLFGGVAGSSAGMASADISGAEQMRQFGQATTQAQQNLQQLGQAELGVQQNLANSLQQLEIKKQQDLLKLRDTFRQELNQISQSKGALAQNKAQAQLSALQDYNNRKRTLEDMVTQQRLNIETYAKQLQLANQYKTTTNPDTSKIYNLTTLANPNFDAKRAADSLMMYNQSDNGKLSLQSSGWKNVPTTGGRDFWVNSTNGRTIDSAGNEYQPFFLDTYLNQSKDNQKPLSDFLLKK